MTRALALIDGEHYPDVVREALEELPFDFVGAVLVGGTEKVRGGEEYGVPLLSSLEEVSAEVVVDLSDEPVLGPKERFLWASRALARGMRYIGADFRFDPPRYEPFVDLPAVAVLGTGKRVGKTAVTTHLARLLSREHDVLVVAMGRGGPEEPDLRLTPPTIDELLALSRLGRHAASDYLEIAVLAGVPTIGCRRAGGGLAGQVFTHNLQRAVRVVEERRPDVVVFDGSGAAIPPVAVGARVLVVGRGQDPTAYLNAYRVLVSDLVLLVGDGDARAVQELKDVPVVAVDLRLRPLEPLHGKRVAVFTTGEASVDDLGVDVVHVSRNLARREALRNDLAAVDADAFLVELKAAAIDVVAEEAVRRGTELVFATYDVVSRPGQPDIDDLMRALVPAAVAT